MPKLAAFIYVIVLLLTTKETFRLDRIELYIITPFLLAIVFLLSNFINSGQGYLNIPFLLNIFLFWFIINHYRRNQKILGCFIIWYVLGAIVLSACFVMGIGVHLNETGRMTMFGDSTNTDTNSIGTRTGMAIILIVYLIMELKNKWLKLILSLPLLALISLSAMLASRTGILVWVLGVSCLVLFSIKKRIYKFVAVCCLISAGIIGFNIMESEELKVYERIMDSVEKGDVSSRDDLWKMYVPAVEQNPVWGIGIDGMNMWSRVRIGDEMSPHNVFLEVALLGGLIGISVFLWFIGSITYTRVRRYLQTKEFVYVTFLIPMYAQLVSGQVLYVKWFWVLAALSIAESLQLSKKTILSKRNETGIVYS